MLKQRRSASQRSQQAETLAQVGVFFGRWGRRKRRTFQVGDSYKMGKPQEKSLVLISKHGSMEKKLQQQH